MIFTDHEKAKIKTEKLRPNCKKTESGYSARVRDESGVLRSRGVFDSIAECNAAYDKHNKVREEQKSVKKYAQTGYVVAGTKERKRYKAQVALDARSWCLGTFNTAREARAEHELAVDRINAGTFKAWYEKWRKTSARD